MTGDVVPSIYYDSIVNSLRESGIKVLEQTAALVRRADVAGDPQLIETLGGRVADQIVKQARDWSADLIVMGVPPRSFWMNVHPDVLHLWEPRDEAMIEQWRANALGQVPT